MAPVTVITSDVFNRKSGYLHINLQNDSLALPANYFSGVLEHGNRKQKITVLYQETR